MEGALSVSQRAHALLHGRPRQGAVPLLRLRRGRRRHPLRPADRPARLSRGGRGARGALRRRDPPARARGVRATNSARSSSPRSPRRRRFYAAELAKPGNPAAAYLEERNVPESVARALGLGYAPAGWETLAQGPRRRLARGSPRRRRPAPAGARGNAFLRPVPRPPRSSSIRDERGRPVGFSGRALSADDEPKYLNSPESPVFLKKRLLYALTDAREAIRRPRATRARRGYFDHLALYPRGSRRRSPRWEPRSPRSRPRS